MLHLTYPLCYLLSQEQPPITTNSASANSTADAIKASLTYKLLDNNNSSVFSMFFLKSIFCFSLQVPVARSENGLHPLSCFAPGMNKTIMIVLLMKYRQETY